MHKGAVAGNRFLARSVLSKIVIWNIKLFGLGHLIEGCRKIYVDQCIRRIHVLEVCQKVYVYYENIPIYFLCNRRKYTYPFCVFWKCA